MLGTVRTYGKKIRRRLTGFYRQVMPKKYGVNLIGFFSHTFGVAEIGRFFAQRLIRAQAPFIIFDIALDGYARLDSDSLARMKPYYSAKTHYHKNLFFVNADTINHIEYLHPELFTGRYNAAVFFWEFDDYFHFPKAFTYLDEVIAFTEFIATAIRKVAPPHVKVTHLPPPFVQSWQITQTGEAVRSGLAIGTDDFVFIFNFDFYSVYNRKNPEALLKAFEAAFTRDDKVWLVLKTIHAEATNPHYRRFAALVEQMALKDKIMVINENMGRNEFMSLLNAADCYVSLHRSEGLGLGMMEAMSMGKPVIATGYGGNTDFMNNENSLLLPYTLVPVEPGSGPYEPGWLWADASVEDASRYMKKLYGDQRFARSLGETAAEYITSHYSQEAFNKMFRTWMNSEAQ